MADSWEDEDEWDVDSPIQVAPKTTDLLKHELKDNDYYDEEEDLAVIEKEKAAKADAAINKTKGKALLDKKRAEDERKEDLEIARRAAQLEMEMEENMTLEERRILEKKRVEMADNALTDDLFGTVGTAKSSTDVSDAGDSVNMKDLKDHLKHARKVAQCIKSHGKIPFATAFLKECIQECSSVLDDDAVSDIIKLCNIIKNDKIAAAKSKAKIQAQKAAKKKDKAAEAAAKKMTDEIFGETKNFDEIDEMAARYEDDFF